MVRVNSWPSSSHVHRAFDIRETWEEQDIVAVTPDATQTTENYWIATVLCSKRQQATIRWWESVSAGQFQHGATDTIPTTSIICALDTEGSSGAPLLVPATIGWKIVGSSLQIGSAPPVAVAFPAYDHARATARGTPGSVANDFKPTKGSDKNIRVSPMKRMIRKAAGLRATTLGTYQAYWQIFIQFCQQTAQSPLDFSIQLVEDFAEHIALKEGKRCHNIAPYFSALNYVYSQKGLGRPWSSAQARSVATGFGRVQTTRSKQQGCKAPQLRIATPAIMIDRLINEQWEGPQAKFPALCLVSLLTGLRADSLSDLDTNSVKFTKEGHMLVTVERCKNTDAAVVPYNKTVFGAPAGHPRAKAFNIIAEGAQWFTPSKHSCSDAISTWMDKTLLKDVLAPGTFVSSHSWRKAGASVLCVTNRPLTEIIAYGGWKPGPHVHQTISRYVDTQYVVTTGTRQLFEQ